MQPRNVIYTFPKPDKAGDIKVFQDRTSQIRGFYFVKSMLNVVEQQTHSSNYCVYFLINEDEENTTIYIGKSENGINRIKNHLSTKDFWSYCIMFVTDNNSFDSTSIDYLEYYFINRFNETTYVLDNSELRKKEPTVNEFDKYTYLSYIDHIEFLLSCNGIAYADVVDDFDAGTNTRMYTSIRNHNAKLYIRDGKYVLQSGSEITRPKESVKNWSDDGAFYNRCTKYIDSLMETDKIIECKGKLILNADMEYKKPSFPASLVSGGAENGYTFWKGLDEHRQKEQEQSNLEFSKEL